MEIKSLTHKELNKLLKLKCNKNFKDNFSMFLPAKMATEITFIAVEGQEILGALSYSHSYLHGQGKITVGDKQYEHTSPVKFLEFIEVKPDARNKKVAQHLLEHVFDIFKVCQYSLLLSNLVLDGKNLVPLYERLSDKYQVDLFFSPLNKEYTHKIHSVPPIEHKTKKWKLW